jgi:adenylate cyclase
MNTMNGSQFDYNTWINSKELIKKTNISRATLNNYIKAGIIPQPVIKKPADLEEKAKKIGYFPLSVLDTILNVKKLKKEGYSVEKIAINIKQHGLSEHVIKDDNEKLIFMQEKRKRTPEDFQSSKKELRFGLEDIHAPAYLVNYNYEIEWVNAEAEEKIFHQSVKSKKTADSRNIFKLFFNWEFHHSLTNWEKFIDFHVAFVKLKYSKEALEQLYSDISEREVNLLKASFDKTMTVKKEIIVQSTLTVEKKDGTKDTYRVYATFFREGIFFLYEPADYVARGAAELLLQRENVIKDLLQKRLPTLVPFCVLVADLQESVRICAELLAEDYFDLIKHIYGSMEDSFKKYYGVYGKHAGDGIVYYFLKERESNYLTNAIYCAKEIQKKMEILSAEWRINKKWHNDLYLNIGINEGEEFFGTIPSSNNVEFTALGDTINFAARLSCLARCGAIVTTKNLINRLNDEERANVRFGIRKHVQDREVFIENMFSRVIDLMPVEDLRRDKFIDIATLIVTEITT